MRKTNSILLVSIISLVIIGFFVACDNSGEKKSLKNNDKDKTERNRRERESKPENGSNQVTEDLVIDKVYSLPEVKERAEYIKKETNGERKLKIWIAARPEETGNYYWVKVGEDNGMSLVTHFDFYVYTDPMEIYYYDVLTDMQLSISEWRKTIE